MDKVYSICYNDARLFYYLIREEIYEKDLDISYIEKVIIPINWYVEDEVVFYEDKYLERHNIADYLGITIEPQKDTNQTYFSLGHSQAIIEDRIYKKHKGL